MDKNKCEDRYSETETEEHLNGKRDLYEWIKKQPCITDAILEGWIPETKQRPDIMFKYSGKQYVIEYQCSPIASEYIERHELYQAAGINDIWILGAEKYLKPNMRQKYIQEFAYGFYSYLDNNMIPIKFSYLYKKIKLRKSTYCHNSNLFYGVSLNNFAFDGDIFDHTLGKTDIVISKIELRKKYKEEQLTNIPRRHNKYLKIQNDKLYDAIKHNLALLSNENWKFRIMYTQSKFCSFEYIVAEPMCAYRIIDYHFDRNFKYKKYERVNIEKMNYEIFKQCARDIEYLKRLLLPMMLKNKRVLLKYKDENLRFMEVQ